MPNPNSKPDATLRKVMRPASPIDRTSPIIPQLTHQVFWKKPIGGRPRKGESCAILRQKGKMAHVRFADGSTALINRMGLRAASKGGVSNPNPT